MVIKYFFISTQDWPSVKVGWSDNNLEAVRTIEHSYELL